MDETAAPKPRLGGAPLTLESRDAMLAAIRRRAGSVASPTSEEKKARTRHGSLADIRTVMEPAGPPSASSPLDLQRLKSSPIRSEREALAQAEKLFMIDEKQEATQKAEEDGNHNEREAHAQAEKLFRIDEKLEAAARKVEDNGEPHPAEGEGDEHLKHSEREARAQAEKLFRIDARLDDNEAETAADDAVAVESGPSPSTLA